LQLTELLVSLHNQIASTRCVITRTISKIDALESDIFSTKIDFSYQKKKRYNYIGQVRILSISDMGNKIHAET